MSEGRLLAPDEPAPVECLNAGGRSPFLLIGDHAGRAIPRALGALGLSEADRARHIAWDIGVAGVGEALAGRLDAAFVRQVYSRLVIDCNRDPASEDAIPAVSDGTPIPGNVGLDDAARAIRVEAIHAAYHRSIARVCERRRSAGQPTILIALHSFTPELAGARRPWPVGILHGGGDERFARALLAVLRASDIAPVGDNEPYRMDATDHSVPRHAFAAGLTYAEIEVRQDLLGDGSGQASWAARLERALRAALDRS